MTFWIVTIITSVGLVELVRGLRLGTLSDESCGYQPKLSAKLHEASLKHLRLACILSAFALLVAAVRI